MKLRHTLALSLLACLPAALSAQDAVPQAMAATAWAPPMRKISVTPARLAAARTNGFNSPSGVGTHIAMRGTPAARAGMAFISTEDG